MLVRGAVAALICLVVFAAATPVPQRQIGGFFGPGWGFPGADYGDSTEDSGSSADYPDYTNLGAMLQGMQAMMTRMRQQLAEAMNRFPQVPKVPRPFKPSDAGFDERKPTNSSSTTKVINGHKVTVNETVYTSGGDGSSAVFHIKTVDISPHKPEEPQSAELEPTDVEKVAAAAESSEMPAESTEQVSEAAPATTEVDDNEIPQSRDNEWQHDTAEVAESRPAPRSLDWSSFPSFVSKWRKNKFQEPRAVNPDAEMLPHLPSKPIDLSSDLRVNQLLSERAEAGGLIQPDPDSEFVEIQDGKLVPNIQVA